MRAPSNAIQLLAKTIANRQKQRFRRKMDLRAQKHQTTPILLRMNAPNKVLRFCLLGLLIIIIPFGAAQTNLSGENLDEKLMISANELLTNAARVTNQRPLATTIATNSSSLSVNITTAAQSHAAGGQDRESRLKTLIATILEFRNEILAIIGIVVSIFLVKWTVKSDRRLASDTGAFRKRELHIFVEKHEIHKCEIWCFCFPEESTDRSCVEVGISIMNTGSLTCSDIVFTINAAKDLIPPQEAHPPFRVFPAAEQDRFKCVVADTDELRRHVSYNLPLAHPKCPIEIHQWICLAQSLNAPFQCSVQTKGKKTVKATLKTSFSYPMTLAATATDCEVLRNDVEIFGLRADSFEIALEDLRRVIGIPPSTAAKAQGLPEHLVRFFKLKVDRRESSQGFTSILFKVAEMRLTVLREQFRSISIPKCKTELIGLDFEKRRKRKRKPSGG